MGITQFEEIISWKKAQDLSYDVYQIFKTCKDYSFRDQIQRAAVSVSNNIAEGFERRTNKEFRQFLYIARGSCGEVRSMLPLAERLGFVTSAQSKQLYEKCVEISKLIYGLSLKV